MIVKNKILITLFFCLFSATFAAAQDKPVIRVYIATETTVIDGKKYYLHTVEKGQTLYALSVAYDVSVNDIIEINAIEDNIISIGQVLKIPKIKPTRETKPDAVLFDEHKVEAGETLFSLSQLYDTPIEIIEKYNPVLVSGLKAGQIILIPKKIKTEDEVEKVEALRSAHDSLIDAKIAKDYFIHVVQRRETLFSISQKFNVSQQEIINLNPGAEDGIRVRQELKIPQQIRLDREMDFVDVQAADTLVMDEKTPPTYFSPCETLDPKRKIRIALLMPLYLDEVDDITTNFTTTRYQRQRHQRINAFTYLQFYQGFMLALDSLKKAGLQAEVYVFDLDNNVSLAHDIIKKEEMRSADLIIGPFHNEPFAIVADFAKQNSIHIINPVVSSGNLIVSNGHLINVAMTASTQLEQFVRHIKSKHHDKNIILVHNNTNNERNILNIFESYWNSIETQPSGLSFHKVAYNINGLAGVRQKIKADQENLILCINTNEAFVSNFLRLLNTLIDHKDKENNNISLYGLPSWQNYGNLEISYLQNLNYRYFSTAFVDYNEINTINFIKKFRDKYAIEPNDFAFMGYDMAMYFSYSFYNYGKDFTNCINDIPVKTLRSAYEFRYNNSTNAFENTYLNFLRYKDYELIKE